MKIPLFVKPLTLEFVLYCMRYSASNLGNNYLVCMYIKTNEYNIFT